MHSPFVTSVSDGHRTGSVYVLKVAPRPSPLPPLDLLYLTNILPMQAARRVGAGSLTNLETTIFRRACAFLSYEDGRKMAGGARFLRDMARRLRKEWELRPFNPRVGGTKAAQI